jgi:hypothetical protein
LPPGQSGGFLEGLAQLASGSHGPLGSRLAQEFLDRDAQGLSQRGQDIGAGNLPAPFPVA